METKPKSHQELLVDMRHGAQQIWKPDFLPVIITSVSQWGQSASHGAGFREWTLSVHYHQWLGMNHSQPHCWCSLRWLIQPVTPVNDSINFVVVRLWSDESIITMTPVNDSIKLLVVRLWSDESIITEKSINIIIIIKMKALLFHSIKIFHFERPVNYGAQYKYYNESIRLYKSLAFSQFSSNQSINQSINQSRRLMVEPLFQSINQ